MMRNTAWLVGLTMTMASGLLARSDVVVLKDGSRVICHVERMVGGKLHLTTDFAGALDIDNEKVAGISTQTPLNVEFASGERAVGPLTFDEKTGQSVRSPQADMRPRFFDMTTVQNIWQPGTDSPELAVVKQAAKDAQPKWALRVESGLNGQTGNTDRTSFLGRAEVTRTTPKDRTNIYGQGRYSRENGVRTVNEIMGGAGIEVDVTDRLFWFAKANLEHDPFENLDLRSNVSGGLGTFLIRDDDLELKIRGGLGYEHESFSDGSIDDAALAEFGVDYRKEFSQRLHFTHSTTYYPKFDDFLAGYRLVSESAAELPMNKDNDWKLRLGLRSQYDALPVAEINRLDTFYFANLVWDLK